MERIKSINKAFDEGFNSILNDFSSIPKNATIKEEFVKCGKDTCNNCPHGPYYYPCFKDKSNNNNNRKLRKKYLGVIGPRL